MSDPLPFLPTRVEVRARYHVELLADAVAGERGVLHREGGEDRILPWSQVRRVVASEVGEPQGVRTIIFDLVVGVGDEEFRVRRFDAEPGQDAVEAAELMARHVPGEFLCASIKALTTDGLSLDWHPDLESFEESALAALYGFDLGQAAPTSGC
jgi:hypothetical protein